jgi:uncharacterized membrane protein
LLRNPKYCIYGATSQKTCSSTSSLETAFNSASVKERSKFEQETLVNVGGSSTRRSSYRPSSSGRPDELIVVTMLVATGCKANIPEKINSLADLKAALETLGGLPQDQVLGVELMWTPQVRGRLGSDAAAGRVESMWQHLNMPIGSFVPSTATFATVPHQQGIGSSDLLTVM